MNTPKWLEPWLRPRRIERPFSGGKLLFQALVTVGWVGTWRFVQREDLSPFQRAWFPFMPIVSAMFFVGMLEIVRRKKRQPDPLDEMQRRIWLESMKFSYQISFAVLSTVCLLQAIHPSISTNPFYRLSWLVLPLSQTLGAWIAYLRYR